jgi:acetyltransferase-like isoleucine patch superfamily enzyme
MIRLARRLYRSIITYWLLRHLKRKSTLAKDVTVSKKFAFRYGGTDQTAFSVGNNTHLDGLWVIQGKGRIKVGNFCSFRQGTYIGSVDSIVIGDHVFGAENIFIIDNNNHPVGPEIRKSMTLQPPNSPAWKWTRPDVDHAAVIIEDNVWIGRNSMILKGVAIGKGSIIAAGAVVTKSVPPFSVVAGNPARIVKRLSDDESITLPTL